MVTRDLHVRGLMLESLRKQHEGDPETRIVEELGVAEGSGRIDIAVVNGTLAGFELKSARDDLHRLPRQSLLFGGVFDELTLVVAGRHVARAEEILPAHWGLVLAETRRDASCLTWLRLPANNPDVAALPLAQLLWRDEALALLEERGCAQGLRSKSRVHIWERLTEVLTLEELKTEVRRVLRSRTAWRSGE